MNSFEQNELGVTSMSLTEECARKIRYNRKIDAITNRVNRAIEAGYLTTMYGFDKPQWVTFEVESHYAKGAKRAKTMREFLNSRNLKWSETVIEKISNGWKWITYQEGYMVASGSASSRIKAEHAASDTLIK